ANAIWGPGTGDAQVQAATWRETIKSKRDGPVEVLRSMRARLRSHAPPAGARNCARPSTTSLVRTVSDE
ncbi:MAG: hypothetical protein ACLP1X_26350, partial [Polyangiaceae bacterium]